MIKMLPGNYESSSMNSVKMEDTKLIHRWHQHSYTLTGKDQKEKGNDPVYHCNKTNKIPRNKPTQEDRGTLKTERHWLVVLEKLDSNI